MSRLIFFLIFLLLTSSVGAEQHDQLRIAAFPFKPLIFQDTDGTVKGINVDILNRILQDNNRQPSYVNGSWNQGLELAREGKIDLLTSVMHTEERDKYLDYSKEPVFIVWGEVYALAKTAVPNLFALDGKKIAIMKGDLSGNNFRKLAESFHITCAYVEVPSHNDVFAMIRDKKVFAGVAPNIFGLVNALSYQVTRTSIIFSPNPLYFAAPEGTNHQILNAIDQQLQRWKKDQDSFYYQTLDRWLSPSLSTKLELPKWVVYVFAIGAGFVLLLIVWGRTLTSAVKKRTRELQESETRYLTLFQNNRSVLMLVDPDSDKIVEANPAACNFYERTREELLQIEFTKLNSLEKNRIQAELGKVAAEKCIYFNFNYQPENGSPRNVLLYSCPIEIKGEQLLYTIVHDDTERIEAEQRLKNSEAKYKLLADHTYDWEYWLDADGQYQYVSPACEKITGYPAGEFMTNPQLMFDLVLPSHLARVEEHYQDKNREKPGCSLEFALLAKNGREVWIEHQCGPVYDDQGNFCGRRGNNRDITERKMAQQEQERLLKAITQCKEVIVITDAAAQIQYANPAFTTVTGYATEEVIGRNPRIMQSGQHERTFYKTMWKTLSEGKTWEGQIINKRKDGSLFVEEATISPVCNPEGKIENYVAVKRDITERIDAEQKRHELEAQVAQKSKMEALGLLAGGMAHNFNNNLAIILGNIEILGLLLKEDQTKSEYIRNAKVGITRARELIQQIMSYSRTGEKIGGNVKLKTVLDETVTLLQSTLPSTVELVYQQAPEMAELTIVASPTRVQEALFNLSSNAVFAMDEKGLLTISLDRSSLKQEDIPAQYPECSPGEFACLTVSDTGCGIAEENLTRIFDPFFTTKDINSGTGMGLPSMQGFVSEIGGMISLASQVGKGTTFKLYFPLTQDADQAGKDRTSRPHLHGSEKILLVDDDKMVVSVNQQLLTAYGYQVSVETTGHAALETFRKDPQAFDMVITDQSMPKITGDEMLVAMLAIRSNLKTIVYTGYEEKLDKETAQQMGIGKILKKPLSHTEFLEAIRELFDSR